MAENTKLTEEEICECLKSLNVQVRMSELKLPAKDFIVRVFEAFLNDLKINPMNTPFDAIKYIENPEIYEYAQFLIMLSSTMTLLLQRITGELKITVNDIVNPKPKKTKKILNYLILFWNYYLRKEAYFQEREAQLNPILQKMEILKIENEDLKEKYSECVNKLKNWSPPKKELYSRSAAIREKQIKCEEKKEALMAEYSNLKDQEHKLQTEINETNLAIVTAKEELSELSQLIISTPEKSKIDSDIQKMKDQLRDVKEKVHNKEMDLKEKKKIFESLSAAEADIVKIYTKEEKIYEELQSITEQAQQAKSLFIQSQEENKNLKELLSTLEMQENMAGFYEQKLAKKQWAKKCQMEEIDEQLEKLRAKVAEEKIIQEQLNLADDQVRSQINESAESVVQIVEKCQEAKREFERTKALYESQVQSVKDSFKGNCKEITDKVKHIYGY